MGFNLIIRRERMLRLIWLLPLVALAVSISLIYQTHFNKGPEVLLLMDNADGLAEGKTLIKALSVDVGKVAKITLSDDLKHVEVLIQLNPNTEHLLKSDTIFYIQKPRIDRQGVTGLNTILSGYYIEMVPGVNGQARDKYNLSPEPPIKTSKDDLIINLYSESNRVLFKGDDIRFKGIIAGVVIDKSYDDKTQKVKYIAAIYKDFAHLVNKKTSFWVNSGITVDMNVSGIKFYTESIENIVKGGVSFDNIDTFNHNIPKAKQGDSFVLFTNRAMVVPQFKKVLKYIILLDDFSNKVAVKTPVLYKGIQIGQVQKSPYLPRKFKLFKDELKYYPILIDIEMDRFEIFSEQDINEVKEDFEAFLEKKNITASLELRNFLTGIYNINLIEDSSSSDDKEKYSESLAFDGYKVIHARQDSINSVKNDIQSFIHNLNKLKINELVDNLNNLLINTNNTGLEVQKLSANINELLHRLQEQDISGEIVETLNKLQHTLDSYDQDSKIYGEFEETLKILNVTLKSLKPITQNLEEKSNSLIFSDNKEDPTPRKK